MTVFISACSKDNGTTSQGNNEVNATIVTSTGTININAKGTKAIVKCSYTLLGVSNYVYGANDNNAAVSINIINPANPNATITSPGTYNMSCEYKMNKADPNAGYFLINGLNAGSITVTAANDHHMEGNFTSVARCAGGNGCVYNKDSVLISGTFKGDY